MPKLRVLSGREVCTILARHGFSEVRRNGSHIVMKNAEAHRTLPVPDHKELDRGTLIGIIHQSGIDRSYFEV